MLKKPRLSKINSLFCSHKRTAAKHNTKKRFIEVYNHLTSYILQKDCRNKKLKKWRRSQYSHNELKIWLEHRFWLLQKLYRSRSRLDWSNPLALTSTIELHQAIIFDKPKKRFLIQDFLLLFCPQITSILLNQNTRLNETELLWRLSKVWPSSHSRLYSQTKDLIEACQT